MKHRVVLLLFFLSLALGCVDPFQPPVSDGISHFLIVDGFINSTEHAATVKLSRAVRLSESNAPVPEYSALVSIEDDGGAITLLNNYGNGTYRVQGLNPDYVRKYRIKITTSDGRQYVSDFIALQPTPPIDSVRWEAVADGVQIYVNTHDPSGSVLYYRWNFEETWQYNSVFDSSVKLVGGEVVIRDSQENIFDCWKSSASTNILINSTVRLDHPLVRDFPVTLIPTGSDKLVKRYSIIVNQIGMSKEAYDYWRLLEKTTENLGGLFDPLPSQVKGNVHSISDPAEVVLGYFSGGSVASARIFISINDLPAYLRIPHNKEDCEIQSILKQDVTNLSTIYLLISPFGTPSVVGYYYSFSGCIDCREKGGTNIKPDYW